ncbi:MAG: 23S rRNA (guanosine(2251)-2'-O)-methyltransferase RlmB [Deltaproteobacteria bacterium]|nr:23S rRNA (guanosine(2251)-2'-O)-methyltransferase RlmB [Deltaproteobacteria bacterium]
MGDLLYGIHPVAEALAAGRRRFNRLLISKRRGARRLNALLDQARTRGVPVVYKAEAFFRSELAGATHQGIAADVEPLPLGDEDAILERAEREGRPAFVLVLDGIMDPQNLGSLIRTALAMGVHGIVLPKDRCAPLSPAVSRASSGAMEHMVFWRVTNLVSCLKRLKDLGLWVIGADRRSGGAVFETDLTQNLALVIGGEEKGIRPLVRRTCDLLVCIPQADTIDSLNAATAGAMVMYEAVRQRRGMVTGH